MLVDDAFSLCIVHYALCIVRRLAVAEHGGLAQLVEHLLCKQGVNGSSPLSSTTKRSLTCWEREKTFFVKKQFTLGWRCAIQSRESSKDLGLNNLRKDKGKANKGAWGMPVALGGDEGRDKLRKAAVSGKCAMTRRCPNGETRRQR